MFQFHTLSNNHFYGLLFPENGSKKVNVFVVNVISHKKMYYLTLIIIFIENYRLTIISLMLTLITTAEYISHLPKNEPVVIVGTILIPHCLRSEIETVFERIKITVPNSNLLISIYVRIWRYEQIVIRFRINSHAKKQLKFEDV